MGKVDCCALSSVLFLGLAEVDLHLLNRCGIQSWVFGNHTVTICPPSFPVLFVIKGHHDVLDPPFFVVFKANDCSKGSVDKAITDIEICGQHYSAALLEVNVILQGGANYTAIRIQFWLVYSPSLTVDQSCDRDQLTNHFVEPVGVVSVDICI